MQLYASKKLGQFAPERVGQFDWIVQLVKMYANCMQMKKGFRGHSSETLTVYVGPPGHDPGTP